jgi:hypothetical protein
VPENYSLIWISQVLNLTALFLYAVAVVIAVVLVARDAAERGYRTLAVMGWCALTVFAFPVGLALYLLFVKKDLPKPEC